MQYLKQVHDLHVHGTHISLITSMVFLNTNCTCMSLIFPGAEADHSLQIAWWCYPTQRMLSTKSSGTSPPK